MEEKFGRTNEHLAGYYFLEVGSRILTTKGTKYISSKGDSFIKF